MGRQNCVKTRVLQIILVKRKMLWLFKTRIIAQVAQAYYNLISLDQQLKIANENVKLSEDILRMMRLQYNSGQVNSLAIEQAEAQKKNSRALLFLWQSKI